MTERKKAKGKKVEYRPVHEVVRKLLVYNIDKEGMPPYIQRLIRFAELYKEGVIVPADEIPALIKAFNDAESAANMGLEIIRKVDAKHLNKAVLDVIGNLEQQLAEAKEKEKTK